MDRVGTMTERVGANVRRLRQERDLSMRVVTERLQPLGWQISVQGFSRLETGQRGITVDHLALLAEVFDVSMASLLDPLPERQMTISGGGSITINDTVGVTDAMTIERIQELIRAPMQTMLDKVTRELRIGLAEVAATAANGDQEAFVRIMRQLLAMVDKTERKFAEFVE